MNSLSRQSPFSAMVLLFSATLFLGSFLLFLVEPIVAKAVLPVLGGAPMVWNGCVLFFQCTLLAGYAYAHATASGLGPRLSLWAYVVLLIAPFAFLPFAITPAAAPPDGHPLVWLFVALIGSIGAPFFVLASGTSVMQMAYAQTSAAARRDPYFLYIASNAGSLLGLLTYPLLVEPALRLNDQGRIWTIGYAAWAAMAIACVFIAQRISRRWSSPAGQSAAPAEPAAPIDPWRRARWIALAAIPSSLMLGVTGYLTTDIASFPLMWVVPLALYLVTFILAFARPAFWRALADRRLPLGIVTVAVFILLNVGAPVSLVVFVHLATFVLAGLLCHSALAEDRPPSARLTEFYLWIAVGGVIGSLFNTLIAPVLFNGVAEYPIALVLAACFRRGETVEGAWSFRGRELTVPLAVGLLTFVSILGLHYAGGPVKAAFYLPAFLCLRELKHPARFASAVAAVLIVGALTPYGMIYGQVLEAHRTFFGVYRVSRDPSGRYFSLHHGTTLHGLEVIDRSREHEPLTYFHRDGPFGQAFARLPQAATTPEVAVIGLGIGALASYAGPNQRWTFYEIDPLVEQIARDDRYFTHMSTCGARCEVITGDARLSMAKSPDGAYGLLVLDAFSSDAIPVHLLTTEAISLYLSKLAPSGVLAFHISNRHLTLGSVLGKLAAQYGLTALEQVDRHPVDLTERGQSTSNWMVMARRAEDLGPLLQDPRWRPPTVEPSTPLWTDDFSNILSVFRMGD